MYVKRETDICKKNWLSGHRLFANRPADTVRSLPSDRRYKSAEWTRAFMNEVYLSNYKSAEWTRAFMNEVYLSNYKSAEWTRAFMNEVMNEVYLSNYKSAEWTRAFMNEVYLSNYKSAEWTRAFMNEVNLSNYNLFQLPYYIDGDIKITQSNAILRYIARKHGLCM